VIPVRYKLYIYYVEESRPLLWFSGRVPGYRSRSNWFD
jgi:hypothetical protein